MAVMWNVPYLHKVGMPDLTVRQNRALLGNKVVKSCLLAVDRPIKGDGRIKNYLPTQVFIQ